MDARYWVNASPRKPTKLGCGIRAKSKRTTQMPYRTPAAALRRRLRKQYRKQHPDGMSFKRWLNAVVAVGVAA